MTKLQENKEMYSESDLLTSLSLSSVVMLSTMFNFSLIIYLEVITSLTIYDAFRTPTVNMQCTTFIHIIFFIYFPALPVFYGIYNQLLFFMKTKFDDSPTHTDFETSYIY